MTDDRLLDVARRLLGHRTGGSPMNGHEWTECSEALARAVEAMVKIAAGYETKDWTGQHSAGAEMAAKAITMAGTRAAFGEEHVTCAACGGSGGGDEPHLTCRTCGGTGKKP